MARNPVQFQKGISLNEFLSLYGTNAVLRRPVPLMAFVCPNSTTEAAS